MLGLIHMWQPSIDTWQPSHLYFTALWGLWPVGPFLLLGTKMVPPGPVMLEWLSCESSLFCSSYLETWNKTKGVRYCFILSELLRRLTEKFPVPLLSVSSVHCNKVLEELLSCASLTRAKNHTDSPDFCLESEPGSSSTSSYFLNILCSILLVCGL